MRVFFLSDLHIDDGRSDASGRFARFLRSLPLTGDVLVLGGDIFDLFIGDKRVFRERHGEVLLALREVAGKGVRVLYLEGNHDFHVQSVFAGLGNIEVRTEDFELSAGGRRIWVSHGDLIDEDDSGYLLLRAVTRSTPFRALVHMMPGWAVDLIGTRSSKASRRYTSGWVEDEGVERIRRLYVDFARDKVRQGFQHVLVGHSHLPDHVLIEESDRRGEYVNLGYDGAALPFAVLEAGVERFALKSFG